LSSRTKIGALLALVAAIGLLGIVGLKPTQVSATAGAFGGVPATLGVGATSTSITATFVDESPQGAASLSVSAPGVLIACAVTDTGANPGVLTFTSGTTTCSSAEDADTISETGTMTFTVLCTAAGTATLTFTHGTTITATIGCGATAPVAAIGGAGCPLTPTLNSVMVCKVNQLGSPLSATFALVGPGTTGSPFGTTIELVTSSTAGSPAGTCSTDETCARVLTTNLGFGSPGSLGIASLPAGTYSLTEITAPGGSIQIQIINGLGQLMPPGAPVTVTIPCASAAACTFLFTNSQPLAGAASAAGSQVVAVIGGSSFGLTNRANVEIAPAPGSDDDARIDIRIRDANNVTVNGAHVTVTTDKGRLAMRQDITQTPAITGYDVIEPPAPNFGTPDAGDPCDIGVGLGTTLTGGTFINPFLPSPSQSIVDGFTNDSGIVSACLFVNDNLSPGITPGRANITVIVENFGNLNPGTFGFFGAANLLLTGTVTVVGPPASVRVTASPTSLNCGEKATITATIVDAVGQNVSDHTRVELISNFGSTIGGTGATLGFPGVGPVNPLSSSAAETFSGVATAFLLTSTEHVGPYEVVVTTGGSTGGFFDPGGLLASTFTPTLAQGNISGTAFSVFAPPNVFGGTGVFSTAPVSAQVTVTCALPGAPTTAAPQLPPSVQAPRTGEGIRPPNTGDAGLASSSSSSLAFAIAGVVVFALAGFATIKVARR